MTDSYVIIHPLRHLLDNERGRYTCSAPILDVGIVTALDEVAIDTERFEVRGGAYREAVLERGR